MADQCGLKADVDKLAQAIERGGYIHGKLALGPLTRPSTVVKASPATSKEPTGSNIEA